MATRMPAEWSPHREIWTACPAHPEYWGEPFLAAREEVLEFVRVLTGAGENVRLCVESARDSEWVREAISPERGLHIHEGPLGDIWLRDTGPLFVLGEDGRLQAREFAFNGWGGKFIMPPDDEMARRIARLSGCEIQSSSMVFEGGALDVDGVGTGLTTTQCLLNANRNPEMKRDQVEAELNRQLGTEQLIWLEKGLVGDHTDGHVDNLARFVGVGKVITQYPAGKEDPNREIYLSTIRELNRVRDVRGRQLDVIEIPSPGRVVDSQGNPLAASHVNFLIANEAVLLPDYGLPQLARAMEQLQECFPDRKVLGLGSRNILTGGGSFHCITQQVPRS